MRPGWGCVVPAGSLPLSILSNGSQQASSRRASPIARSHPLDASGAHPSDPAGAASGARGSPAAVSRSWAGGRGGDHPSARQVQGNPGVCIPAGSRSPWCCSRPSWWLRSAQQRGRAERYSPIRARYPSWPHLFEDRPGRRRRSVKPCPARSARTGQVEGSERVVVTERPHEQTGASGQGGRNSLNSLTGTSARSLASH